MRSCSASGTLRRPSAWEACGCGCSSIGSGNGPSCRCMSHRLTSSCTRERDMDTEYNGALRNPQVDYERADLSARGILLFLIGLFISGVFIELVLWGMFHFLARSEALFPSGSVNPMASAQQK